MNKWRILCVGTLFMAGAISHVAHADDGALNEGAYGPQPLDVAHGVESPLRLAEEVLNLRFGVKRTSVVVTFRFQNTDTTQAVDQLTGFPDISLGLRDYDDREFTRTQGPLIDLKTFVNGEEIQSPVRRGRVWVDTTGTWSPVPVPVRSMGPPFHSSRCLVHAHVARSTRGSGRSGAPL